VYIYTHMCSTYIYILLYIIYSSPDDLTSLFFFAYRICWSFPDCIQGRHRLRPGTSTPCLSGLRLSACATEYVWRVCPGDLDLLPAHLQVQTWRKDQYKMNELLTIDDYNMYILYIYNIHTYMYMYAKRGFYLHDRWFRTWVFPPIIFYLH
jgi:hypothetical protein